MAFPYSSSPSLQTQPCCCGSVQSWASNFAAHSTIRLPGMEIYAAFWRSLDVYWGSLRESLSFPEVGGDKLTTQIVSHCGLDFSEKIMNPPPFLPCVDKDWKQPHSSTQHGLPCAQKPFSAPWTTGESFSGPQVQSAARGPLHPSLSEQSLGWIGNAFRVQGSPPAACLPSSICLLSVFMNMMLVCDLMAEGGIFSKCWHCVLIRLGKLEFVSCHHFMTLEPSGLPGPSSHPVPRTRWKKNEVGIAEK